MNVYLRGLLPSPPVFMTPVEGAPVSIMDPQGQGPPLFCTSYGGTLRIYKSPIATWAHADGLREVLKSSRVIMLFFWGGGGKNTSKKPQTPPHHTKYLPRNKNKNVFTDYNT